MKKATATILLLILALNTAGYYTVFKIFQYKVRKEIKNKIKSSVPENELFVIAVDDENKNRIEWIHSKEFRYEGIMYDVVRKEQKNNNTVLYYCVTDFQETILFAKLDNLVSKDMKGNYDKSSTLSGLFKLLSGVFTLPHSSYSQQYPSRYRYSIFIDHYFSPFQKKLHPPPEKISELLNSILNIYLTTEDNIACF